MFRNDPGLSPALNNAIDLSHVQVDESSQRQFRQKGTNLIQID